MKKCLLLFALIFSSLGYAQTTSEESACYKIGLAPLFVYDCLNSGASNSTIMACSKTGIRTSVLLVECIYSRASAEKIEECAKQGYRYTIDLLQCIEN